MSSGADRVAAGRRVDALDGLRAVAVAAVLVVHALPASGFPGYAGVDVFFVLSGCLITTLLLAERDRTGRVSLPRFWARRVLRLAPAMLVFLAVLYPLGERLVGPDYLSRAVIVAEFRTNLALTVQHVSVHPLEHTWSLGQEMQFYLVWPLVLLALVAVLRLPVAAVQLLLLAATAWSFHALVAVHDHAHRGTDDFRLDGRLGGLLLGCSVALAVRGRAKVLALPGVAEVGLGALVALLLGVCLLRPQTPLQVVVPLAVGCTAVAVGGLLTGAPGPAARLLSLPALSFTGRISYSLYLWHYPFFLALSRRTDLPTPAVVFLEVVLSVAAAAMSYAAIEQPMTRLTARLLAARGAPVVPLAPSRAAVGGRA